MTFQNAHMNFNNGRFIQAVTFGKTWRSRGAFISRLPSLPTCCFPQCHAVRAIRGIVDTNMLVTGPVSERGVDKDFLDFRTTSAGQQASRDLLTTTVWSSRLDQQISLSGTLQIVHEPRAGLRHTNTIPHAEHAKAWFHLHARRTPARICRAPYRYSFQMRYPVSPRNSFEIQNHRLVLQL